MAKNTIMRKVSLRTIIAHKLRLALTLLAVVLGTAFIAGSFMFTNALSNTFDSAVSNAYTGVDAAVMRKEGGPVLDQDMRGRIAADENVKNVNIESSQTVVVANDKAEAYQTSAGTASVQPYYPEDQTVGQPSKLIAGSQPHGPNEAIINDSAAQKYGISVGQKLIVVHPDHRDEVTVVGLARPAVEQGTSIVLQMDEAGFVERYGNSDSLKVSSAGMEGNQLVDYLNSTYPVDAESGQKLAEEASDSISSALKFVHYFLIAFGLIALLVGTFIIANTFSMIVAQRTKEFALLRALGATRRQITGSVVVESLIVGILGSAVGVVAGVGLVAVIKAVLKTQDMPIEGGLGLSVSSIVVPIVLGAVVTVLSAWAPARRAGAVKPVEAMRTTESAAGSSLLIRTTFGGLILVVGVACAVAGVLIDASTGLRAVFVGFGAFSLILGFFLAGPALSQLILPMLGTMIGAPFGSIGKLAATNSRRNPRRAAATAFALTLGVALVTAIGMLGATMKSSMSDVVAQDVRSDYLLSAPIAGGFPTPTQTGALAKDADGVGRVVSVYLAPLTVDGQAWANYGPEYTMTPVIDGNPDDMFNITMTLGTASFDTEPGFIAETEFAQRFGWIVGQSYPVETAVPGKTTQAKLLGTYEKNVSLSVLVVSQSVATQVVPVEAMIPRVVGVNAREGYDLEQLRSNLQEKVKDLVVVQVVSAEEYSGQAAAMVNQMLSILYALLALAVIIAVLGIINTLTLGVIERRQEIGMLRAVGTQRRQIRTMITVESVQISLFGAVMGTIMGLGLGWAFIKVLEGEGLNSTTVPWNQLFIILVGSAVVGALAAVWPAHQAAKTPPLDAIAD